MHYEAGVGHIGGNLSALDALLVLHHTILADDDVFVLSKGHAAGALYVALWSRGDFADRDLETFHAEATRLAGHPVANAFPQIPVATGSLGHGFPMASGIALAKRLQAEPGRVFVLTSDGEWQEGSTWEALIFAHHQALAGLTILIDANGLQGFGSTREVASMEGLGERIAAFGVAVREVDGHDHAAMAAALDSPPSGLQVLILRTVKGKGVSFMENQMQWHYLPLDDELYARAVQEVDAS